MGLITYMYILALEVYESTRDQKESIAISPITYIGTR